MEKRVGTLEERMDKSEKQGKIGRRWQYAIFFISALSFLHNIIGGLSG